MRLRPVDGADTLRFRAADDGVENAPLVPNTSRSNEGEWLLYDRDRFEAGDDDELVGLDKQMRKRPVMEGSFDPESCSFSADASAYSERVVLAPARNRCLVCGGTAGSHDVITAVALGTSAAVRVVCEGLVEGLHEQNEGRADHDGKERVLVFSDSRQDAAHQARFITYAGRYDRMRRRLVRALEQAAGHSLTIDGAVKALLEQGVAKGDNPVCRGYDDADWLPPQVQSRAKAWEEAPLLDDLAVSAGYRATAFNLGLVGVRYAHLPKHVAKNGGDLCADLGLTADQLELLCRAVLDEVRRRRALSRPMLAYHPASPSLPEEFRAADWERRIKTPAGYACSPDGIPLAYMDQSEVPDGITPSNAWRRPKAGGRGPSLERLVKHLVGRMGGAEVTEERMLSLLGFLCSGPRLLAPTKLQGFRKSRDLLQVNADAVELVLLRPEDRFACTVCNVRLPWVTSGSPCPSCHGKLEPWPEEEFTASRYVERILQVDMLPLVAGEHTAQVTGDDRIELEEDFKAPPPGYVPPPDKAKDFTKRRSTLNVLACSPTLEMGIDVGGLDAVVMRNVPPRPDNYAQRGGRAGRRTRVGIVLGYARSTPHDGYFFDKPEEMIAGEVPAPGVPLGNRDVVLRHLHAIAFGSAEPGLAGRMAEYVNIKGELDQAKVDELIAAVGAQFDHAVSLAREAWGPEILDPAGLNDEAALRGTLDRLPDAVRDLFDRVRRQILKLQETIDRWNELGKGDRSAMHAQDLKRKILGLRDDKADRDADDRGNGHPMRRFAEFGILPGYEFPSEPCTLRLWGDKNEDAPVTVARRFGIAQYQPEAKAHARGHRWKVVGLDLSSPWNPKSQEPDWVYVRCKGCDLRYGAQEHAECPRCGSDEALGDGLPGHAYGGFLATRDDTPVLQEEDRFSISALVGCYPQRDGRVVGRFRLPTGWRASLRAEETIRWVNEWKPPTDRDKDEGRPYLHEGGRGFYLCSACGRSLSIPEESKSNKRDAGRRKARKEKARDPYGHANGCERAGEPPRPVAIIATTPATTLRIEVNLPPDLGEGMYERWGYSLGYALRTGLRHLYMLDGPEIEFELEPAWEVDEDGIKRKRGALTFVDGAVGGSGFLDRAAEELHLVAQRTIEHLDHQGCESACYRCLKSYQNQRHHEHLSWPDVMPDLEQLASAPPEPLGKERGDDDDPKPWLAAYDAGVGSPLELAFLRLFEKHGLEVEKQVPVAAEPGGRNISQADFRVVGTKVLIYVDGAAFHKGQRLRRDRAIRGKLRDGEMEWVVVEVRAQDLGRGAELVRAVERACAPKATRVGEYTDDAVVVGIARTLEQRASMQGGGSIVLSDALQLARELGGNDAHALQALEWLSVAGVVRREFLNLTVSPPAVMTWTTVLERLGGQAALEGESWREGARTMALRWKPVRGGSSS